MPVWLDILSYLAIDDKKRACIFAPAGAADPQVYVAEYKGKDKVNF
jgi:hypothetical protein